MPAFPLKIVNMLQNTCLTDSVCEAEWICRKSSLQGVKNKHLLRHRHAALYTVQGDCTGKPPSAVTLFFPGYRVRDLTAAVRTKTVFKLWKSNSCVNILQPRLTFYMWATAGSHPSLSEVAHICTRSGMVCDQRTKSLVLFLSLSSALIKRALL